MTLLVNLPRGETEGEPQHWNCFNKIFSLQLPILCYLNFCLKIIVCKSEPREDTVPLTVHCTSTTKDLYVRKTIRNINQYKFKRRI